MSKYVEYNSYIIKVSNKVLKTFELYGIEEQNYALLLLCGYLVDFMKNKNKNKLLFTKNKLTYFSPVINFSKFDTQFKNKIINKIILDINKLKTKPIDTVKFNNTNYDYNNNNIFSKLCDIIEE